MMERKEQRVWRVGGQDFILASAPMGPLTSGGPWAVTSGSVSASFAVEPDGDGKAWPPASLQASSTHIRAQAYDKPGLVWETRGRVVWTRAVPAKPPMLQGPGVKLGFKIHRSYQ